MNAEAQLRSFIEKYAADVAADAQRALEFLARRMPGATRLVYDNYNALVIGFGPSPRPSEAILSIALYPRYLRLFFLKGVDLPDPHGLLEGNGSAVRSIRLKPVERLELPETAALLDAALAKVPDLHSGGRGALLIKSISARQRPRRPGL